MPLADIRAAYKKKVAIKLDGACRLQEVTTCWSKRGGSSGYVGEQIDCPDYVMQGGRNTCGNCKNAHVTEFGKCKAVRDALATGTNKK